jgi:uncharacterized protein (DUF885 family)
MKKTPRSWLFVFWFLLVPGPLPANEEDSRLAAFFQAFLEKEFQHQPLEATQAGDHRFDHLLDDLSAPARAAWKERTRRTLEEQPRQIDFKKLSRSGQIDFEILRHHLIYALWSADNTRPFENDPRVYSHYLSGSVYLLLTQSTLPASANIKNAIARMGAIPRIVAQAKENLRKPPRVFVETALNQNLGAIAFYQKDLYPLAGSTPQLSALQEAARTAVACLQDYQGFLEKDLLRQAQGAWRLGRDKFYRKLELELDAGLTADQVLAEAEREFERVQRELYVIARQMWSQRFPKKPLPPDDAAGRRQVIRQVIADVGREHGRPEDLVDEARATVAQIKAFIRAHDLLRLPEPDRCQVLEMPEFQRGNSTAFLESAPPLDPRARSVYAISPPPRSWDQRRVNSYLEEYNKHMLQILTIHEAYPGHFVQLEYSNRHPSLIRKMLSSGVFSEGWAVYTEQMMLDQGYGEGNLALRLNQLKFYLRAVANAILDHKMHCQDLSDEQALAFLTQEAYQSEGEAVGKIIRSKQSPCQLSTYFVGRTVFYSLRQTVQREQGEQFQLGRYHEAVLDHGTLPVKYLPELVRERLKRLR